MKNYIKSISLFIPICILVSCKKEKCVSCIAEGNSGKIIKHVMECDKDPDYLKGFQDGLVSYYKENGDTVKVFCDIQN